MISNLHLKNFSWIIIPIFLAVSLQFIHSNVKLLKFPAQDFEVFYLAGKQVLNSQNPYLKVGKDIERHLPPVIVVFSILSLFPILFIQALWFILSICVFLLGSYFLFKLLGFEKNLRIWFYYLTAVIIFFPFRYNLGSGQVNNFLFLFLVLFFYFLNKKKNFFSGFSLALGLLLKITPIFILYTLFIQRKIRIVAWTLFSVVCICIVSIPFLGFNTYLNYLSIPGSFFDFGLSVYTNQSFTGFLARISSDLNLNKYIFLFGIVAGLLLLPIFVKKNRENFKLSLIAFNISIIYMLIFSPFAWQYHFIIAIIPLVTTMYILYRIKSPYLLFLPLAFSYLLIGLNIKNPLIFINLGIVSSFILSHVFLGTVLLLALNIYLLRLIDNPS